MLRRAHDQRDREKRRRQILDAARRLFAAGGGDLPTASAIAAGAGLAKGTLYLYFGTKEAIFADLLLEGWGGMLSDAEALFGGEGSPARKVATFLVRLGQRLDDDPGLLRLDALGPGVIERNMEPEALGRFKAALAERIAAGGTAVDRALELPPGRGATLLVRTYAFTRGLWQTFGGECAEGPPAKTGFKVELSEGLAEYWKGALTHFAPNR